MYPHNIREEELKNKVAKDFFSAKELDFTKILGNVDFCVSYKDNTLFESINFLFAEAKAGSANYLESLTQLILTLGKNKVLEHTQPPTYLGAFDSEQMVFVPYDTISHYLQELFIRNDFNWNLTPSNHKSPQFEQVLKESKEIVESEAIIFHFESTQNPNSNKELKDFIKANFTLANEKTHKIPITKNNFTTIYQKWLLKVAPTISIDWEAEKPDILSSDFYLADLLSENNNTKAIIDSLRILLQSRYYKVKLEKRTNRERFDYTEFGFKDSQKAHTEFWNIYERPPKEEYWNHIIERRDLLVPSDIRERKGAFFTPQIWVRKAQEYLAKVLGQNYQEEYYIWDCAAGTGNLLANLTESHNLYASTLDKADVDIMHELAEKKTLHLLENHIFQFDFLNDEFFDKPCEKHKDKIDSKCKECIESKLPKSLQNILQDSKKRQKLIIFINPPYAETATKRTSDENRINKRGVSFTEVQERYANKIGIATKELFAQFLIRIKEEISDCILAQFSKLKIVQGPNFSKFRLRFKAKFLGGFVCPAYTFDNVKGDFPIGFMMWDLSKEEQIQNIACDVFSENLEFIAQKNFFAYDENIFITDWYRIYHTRILSSDVLGAIGLYGSDFQHNNFIRITNANEHPNRWTFITPNNLIPTCIYLAVRHAIKATWLNDRDQFLYPNEMWEKDSEFQNDCLVFALFHGQNRISSKADSNNQGINHFIPFSEKEVEAKEAFASHFMHKFINGKIKIDSTTLELGYKSFIPNKPLEFSTEAQAVFEAGKEIYKYYHQNFEQIPEIHSQHKDEFYKNYNPNVSLYDIKGYFQGFKENGQGTAKMNIKSIDSAYNDLIADLRYALDKLAKKIKPKIYEYGFLLE